MAVPHSNETSHTRSRRLLWPLLVVCIAGAYGVAASYIPAPQDAQTFWVGNTVAPWFALAFWAGRGRSSFWRGALAGALADLCAVIGFYSRSFADVAPAPFVYQWMVVGICVGAVVGVAGTYQGRTAAAWPALSLAAVFALEPAWHTAIQGRVLPTPAVWVVHVALAVAIVWVLLPGARRPDRPEPGPPPASAPASEAEHATTG